MQQFEYTACYSSKFPDTACVHHIFVSVVVEYGRGASGYKTITMRELDFFSEVMETNKVLDPNEVAKWVKEDLNTDIVANGLYLSWQGVRYY